jgi:hypothetical protein
LSGCVRKLLVFGGGQMRNLGGRSYLSILKLIFTTVLLTFAIYSCGGSGDEESTTTSQESTTIKGYAVDDYILGGTVEVYDMDTSKLIAKTVTKTKGEFSVDVPKGVNVLIKVVGGKLDEDGDNSTTDNQKTFNKILVSIASTSESSASEEAIMVSPVSTALVASSLGISSSEIIDNTTDPVEIISQQTDKSSIIEKFQEAEDNLSGVLEVLKPVVKNEEDLEKKENIIAKLTNNGQDPETLAEDLEDQKVDQDLQDLIAEETQDNSTASNTEVNDNSTASNTEVNDNSTASNTEENSSSSSSTSSTPITLKGLAYDSPISDATVKIKAVLDNGSVIEIATTTADQNGDWQANIDPEKVPDNSTLMVEVSGEKDGKNVDFKSIVAKKDNIVRKAQNNSYQVDQNQFPELITSNVSTIDYILSVMQQGNLSNLVDDPEAILATIKSQKLEVRKKMAGAIKAFIDYNATLADDNNTLQNLINQLVEKAGDGELTTAEIKQIFGDDDYYKVFEAEHQIIKDYNLKDVFTKTSVTADITAQNIYNALTSGNPLYWKDTEGMYRKIVFYPDNITVTFYVATDSNGNNWIEVSPNSDNDDIKRLWDKLKYDPASWLTKLIYDASEDKLYLTTKTGEKYEVILLDNSSSAYSILLNRVSTSPNWSNLLAFCESDNCSEMPIIQAIYDNTTGDNGTFDNISEFIRAFDNCTYSMTPVASSEMVPGTMPEIVQHGCLLGGLEFSDNNSVKAVEINSIDENGNITKEEFKVGEYTIDNNTIHITLYDPTATDNGSSSQSPIKGDIIITLYDNSTMGNYNNLTLINSSSQSFSETPLRKGLPIMFFSIKEMNLTLFTNEKDVQNFVPPQFALMNALSSSQQTSSTIASLPTQAREMLCNIGHTDNNGSSISCSNNYDNITITINSSSSTTTSSTVYTVDSVGALVNNNTIEGYLQEITPFSFTICWGNSPANCSSETTYVNSDKKNELLGDILK